MRMDIKWIELMDYRADLALQQFQLEIADIVTVKTGR